MKVKIEAVDLENFKVVLIDEFKTVEPQKSTQIEERKEKSNIIVDQRLKKIQFLKSKIDEWKSKGLDVSTLEKEVESLEQN
jgi:hypothetical protein